MLIKIGLRKIPANSGKNVFIDKYVVIYCGKDIMLGEQKDKKFAFEEKEGIDLSAYCGEYFLNSEKLFRRLKEEGYELIYGE